MTETARQIAAGIQQIAEYQRRHRSLVSAPFFFRHLVDMLAHPTLPDTILRLPPFDEDAYLQGRDQPDYPTFLTHFVLAANPEPMGRGENVVWQFPTTELLGETLHASRHTLGAYDLESDRLLLPTSYVYIPDSEPTEKNQEIVGVVFQDRQNIVMSHFVVDLHTGRLMDIEFPNTTDPRTSGEWGESIDFLTPREVKDWGSDLALSPEELAAVQHGEQRIIELWFNPIHRSQRHANQHPAFALLHYLESPASDGHRTWVWKHTHLAQEYTKSLLAERFLSSVEVDTHSQVIQLYGEHFRIPHKIFVDTVVAGLAAPRTLPKLRLAPDGEVEASVEEVMFDALGIEWLPRLPAASNH